MAERDPNPGEKLVDPEGLGEVVIGAEIERRHLVVLPAPRREDDNWRGSPLPQLSGDLETIAIGESEIQQDDIGIPGRYLGQALPRRCCLDQPIAVAASPTLYPSVWPPIGRRRARKGS